MDRDKKEEWEKEQVSKNQLARVKWLERLENLKNEFSLEHNPHWGLYETIKEYLEPFSEKPDFISEEDELKCYTEDNIWILRYYPHTPIGFVEIAGSSLKIVLEWFFKDESRKVV